MQKAACISKKRQKKKYELWFSSHSSYVMNKNTRLQYLRTLFSFGRLNKYLRRLNKDGRSLRHPLPQNSAPPVLKNSSYIEVRCNVINFASLDYF